MLANRLENFRGKARYVCKALLPFPGAGCTPVPIASCAASVWSPSAGGAHVASAWLMAGFGCRHWELSPVSRELASTCLCTISLFPPGTVVRFPKTMITFPQKQTSVLIPLPSGVLLLCKGLFPTSQGSCETSFLRVCKTCQRESARREWCTLFFLWSLLENYCSHARCPSCTSEVTTPPEGRTAALEALAGTSEWGFSTFKVSIPDLRGPERACRPWQLLWRERQVPYVCKPSAEGTKFFLHWK